MNPCLQPPAKMEALLGPSNCLEGDKNMMVSEGGAPTPGCGVVTHLGDVSVSFMTLQRADFQNCVLAHAFGKV